MCLLKQQRNLLLNAAHLAQQYINRETITDPQTVSDTLEQAIQLAQLDNFLLTHLEFIADKLPRHDNHIDTEDKLECELPGCRVEGLTEFLSNPK